MPSPQPEWRQPPMARQKRLRTKCPAQCYKHPRGVKNAMSDGRGTPFLPGCSRRRSPQLFRSAGIKIKRSPGRNDSAGTWLFGPCTMTVSGRSARCGLRTRHCQGVGSTRSSDVGLPALPKKDGTQPRRVGGYDRSSGRCPSAIASQCVCVHIREQGRGAARLRLRSA